MSNYLDTYLSKGSKEPWEEKKSIMSNSSSCMNPTRTESYPVLERTGTASAPSSSTTFTSYPAPNDYLNNNGNAWMSSQSNILSALHTSNGAVPGAMITDEPSQSAHISPQSRDTPNSFTYQGSSGSASGSFSYGGGSSKNTPESANLVDPTSTLFEMDAGQYMNFVKGQFTGLGTMPSAYSGQ